MLEKYFFNCFKWQQALIGGDSNENKNNHDQH